MWVLYAFLAAISAALVTILGKAGLKDLDVTLATTIRAIIMAVFLVLVSLGLKKFGGFSLQVLGSKDWVLIILAGIAGAASWLFYFAALKYGLASKVAAIDRLSIVFIVVLSAIFLGETLGWKTFFGALLIAGGALLITLK